MGQVYEPLSGPMGSDTAVARVVTCFTGEFPEE